VDELWTKDIHNGATGLQRVSDKSYALLGVMKGFDLKGNF
jgi:hypothetical protein